MSKLIDRLNRVAKTIPQPMGFKKAAAASARPRMILIASLAQTTTAKSLADYIAGADAVLINKLGSGVKALPRIAQSVPDIPWGLWLGDTSERGIKAIVEAGCDFVVFPASTTLAIPGDNKAGKILQVEASLSEGLLRTMNELPVDAILVASEAGVAPGITWHHLMLFQHFADLLVKPLLVQVPLKVTDNELQFLWKTGVDGIVVAVGIEPPAERLKELRQLIDKLTFPPRRGKKAEALLPRIREETGTETETEEEEEEE